MNTKQLIERYAAGERNFSGVDLRDANLTQINLAGANLSRGILTGANLRRANLSFANLCGTHLEGANLTGANLFRANLRRAFLEEAILAEADLRSANLSEAQLSGADLSDADLWAVKLPEGFTYSPNAKLTRTEAKLGRNSPKFVENFNLVRWVKRERQAEDSLQRKESSGANPRWNRGHPAVMTWEQATLTPEEAQRLQDCVLEIASILHRQFPSDEIVTLEDLQNACYSSLRSLGWTIGNSQN